MCVAAHKQFRYKPHLQKNLMGETPGMRSIKQSATIALLWLGLEIFSQCHACQNAFDYTPKGEPEKVLVTVNQEKWLHFQTMFGAGNLTLLKRDLREIDSDPISVVVQKASQFRPLEEGTQYFVEDSSLSIEGVDDFGVNVRWHVHTIAEHIGKRATWTAYLAFRKGNQVYVYKGVTSGIIVEPRGNFPGFSPYLLPDGETETLAEGNYKVSARLDAFNNWKNGNVYTIRPVILKWNGPFQNDH